MVGGRWTCLPGCKQLIQEVNRSFATGRPAFLLYYSEHCCGCVISGCSFEGTDLPVAWNNCLIGGLESTFSVLKLWFQSLASLWWFSTVSATTLVRKHIFLLPNGTRAVSKLNEIQSTTHIPRSLSFLCLSSLTHYAILIYLGYLKKL